MNDVSKILVTGGGGFIGANLCETLLNKGYQVYCLDNFYSSKKENIAEFLENENFTLIEHDICNEFPPNLPKIVFDEIYHLACPASPPVYQKDHVFTLKTCFTGTFNVLNFAKNQSKPPKVLFSSTSEVYGDPEEHPQKENYRGNVNPHGIRSCYDEGKRVAESLCMNFFRQYGMDIRIIRIFNTYGPKMDMNDGRVISNFIVSALKGEKLKIYGDGKQTRSFQYIDDLISGMMKYMDLPEKFAGPINLGNNNEFTILELVAELTKIFKKNLETEFVDLPDDDPKKRCPDISLAKQKLSWEPKTSLPNGLKKTVEYFKNLVF